MSYITLAFTICALSCVVSPHADVKSADQEGRIAGDCLFNNLGTVLDIMKNALNQLKECTKEATGAGQAIYENVMAIDAKLDELNELRGEWRECSSLKCAPVLVKMGSAVANILESAKTITDNLTILVQESDASSETVTCVQKNFQEFQDAFSNVANC